MKKSKLKNGIYFILASHIFFWLAVNLLAPFIAIFFVNELEGVTLAEVGISSLIYFLSFGVFLPIIGYIEDKIPGLKDEVFFLIFGYVSRGILLILFAISQNVWHLYAIQFLLGLSRALAGPSDKVLYTKFMPQKNNATLWALDESLVNIASAVGAGLGGFLAYKYSFRAVLMGSGILTIFAGIINLYTYGLIVKYLSPKITPKNPLKT